MFHVWSVCCVDGASRQALLRIRRRLPVQSTGLVAAVGGANDRRDVSRGERKSAMLGEGDGPERCDDPHHRSGAENNRDDFVEDGRGGAFLTVVRPTLVVDEGEGIAVLVLQQIHTYVYL